jgi:Flp pilus assembly protein TadG
MTLMIVLLMIMVGMGLDTGQLTYSRATGQAAVDAAALSAVSALPGGIPAEVESRAAAFASNNNYVDSPTNLINGNNVSYVKYDFDTNQITNYSEPIATANGVRVALEAGSAIKTPAFLTPLLKLFGSSAPGANNVNVSAVSVIINKPAIPIALWTAACPANDGTTEAVVKIQMQHPVSENQDTTGENACWSTFFDCSSGAPDIKAGFQVAGTCSGSSISGALDLGSLICQNRGQVNSVLFAAEKFFGTEHPNRWWLVPVIGGGGNCDPNNPTGITSWAKIYPTAYETTKNPKYIEAKVICGPKLINEDTESSLCFSHRLVREPGKGY